jgi:hypothetical protein
MPQGDIKAEIVASMKLHRKIMKAIIYAPIPTLVIISVLNFLYKRPVVSGIVFIGTSLFVLGLVLIGLVLNRKSDFASYFFLIGFMGFMILAISPYLPATLLFLIIWTCLTYLVFAKAGINWREDIIRKNRQKIPIKDIAKELKMSEDVCKKTIDDYSKVSELYKQGKTVHEIGAQLDIARAHVREYLLAMDALEKGP